MLSDKVPETDEQFKERLRRAERKHDSFSKAEEQHASQIQAFSIAAMRAPALTAAGGIAASLGFFSANYSSLKNMPAGLDQFNAVIFWFFVSVIFTVLTPGAAYFNQLCYQRAVNGLERTWEHPFWASTLKSIRAERAGDFFRWLTVILNLLAIIAICIGGYKFILLVGLL
jgi:hypothetical protein